MTPFRHPMIQGMQFSSTRGLALCRGRWPPRSNSRVRLRHKHRPQAQFGDPPSPSGGDKDLRSIIKRKQEELTAHFSQFDEDTIEDRLAAAMQTEDPNPFRLAQLVQSIKMTQGRPVLVFELDRSLLEGQETLESLADLAKAFEAAQADCLCVSTDTTNSEGIKDLFTVARAVKIPVVARDWYIHPIQILEAKEAGASGVLGVIACVSMNGTPLLSSYAAAIGIDAPVEVLNVREVEAMDKHGVSIFCVNCSVGLALAGIAGVASDLTKGILEALPFGAVSLVGIKDVETARRATYAGADLLLVKHECVASVDMDLRNFVEQLRYITSGDD